MGAMFGRRGTTISWSITDDIMETRRMCNIRSIPVGLEDNEDVD